MVLKTYQISEAEAAHVVAAAREHATRMAVPQNIAVVDSCGQLVAFTRMDGAKPFSIEIAFAKAVTAAGIRRPTADLAPVTAPGEAGFGIQHLHGGRLTTLAGGHPLIFDGEVVGAVGVSSGSTAQDDEVARAAVAGFDTAISQAGEGRSSTA